MIAVTFFLTVILQPQLTGPRFRLHSLPHFSFGALTAARQSTGYELQITSPACGCSMPNCLQQLTPHPLYVEVDVVQRPCCGFYFYHAVSGIEGMIF